MIRPKLLFALSIFALAALPFLGATSVTLQGVLNLLPDSAEYEIFWKIRLPRVCFAFLVGGVLSLSGAAYQSIFRNVLVCPFSLGVSSAAALGASIAIAGGLASVWGGEAFFAGLGALIGMGLIVALSRFLPRDGNTSLLLCGVVLGFFFSSLVALVQYVSDYAQLFRLSRWMLGALQVVGYREVFVVFLVSTLGSSILIRKARELDIISLGHDMAITRGVSVQRIEIVVFVITSLMVGTVVSLSGVVGFVGIMVPHMVRAVSGVQNSRVLPQSFWYGGVMVAVCDTIGRLIIPPFEVPVGVITALVGGPFFVWLATGKRKLRF